MATDHECCSCVEPLTEVVTTVISAPALSEGFIRGLAQAIQAGLEDTKNEKR